MSKPSATPPMLRMAIDYGPLLVFFLVNFAMPASLCRELVAPFTRSLHGLTRVEALLVARVIVATVLFVIATVAAVAWSKVKLGRVSPMLLISAVLVLVFGGLTIWFHDPKFIQMKPTFVYAILAAVLGFGLVTGRPLLEGLLGMAYPGLSAAGWRQLTFNWTVFFVGIAIANEIARASLSFDQWVLFKFPGCTIATVLFALANVPMMMRHGLTVEDEAAGRGAAAAGIKLPLLFRGKGWGRRTPVGGVLPRYERTPPPLAPPLKGEGNQAASYRAPTASQSTTSHHAFRYAARSFL